MSDDTTERAEQSSDDDSNPTVEATGVSDTESDDDPLAAFDTPEEEPLDDVFAEMETGVPLSDDDVFERLDEEETAEPEPNVIELQEVEAVDEGVIVPKSQYCEQCEHFSEPPAMRCKNDGTEIHELTDLGHVRVTSCPVVSERTEMTTTGSD